MEKNLISLPDDLAQRMRVFFPGRQRSKVVAVVLEKKVKGDGKFKISKIT